MSKFNIALIFIAVIEWLLLMGFAILAYKLSDIIENLKQKNSELYEEALSKDHYETIESVRDTWR